MFNPWWTSWIDLSLKEKICDIKTDDETLWYNEIKGEDFYSFKVRSPNSDVYNDLVENIFMFFLSKLTEILSTEILYNKPNGSNWLLSPSKILAFIVICAYYLNLPLVEMTYFLNTAIEA